MAVETLIHIPPQNHNHMKAQIYTHPSLIVAYKCLNCTTTKHQEFITACLPKKKNPGKSQNVTPESGGLEKVTVEGRHWPFVPHVVRRKYSKHNFCRMCLSAAELCYFWDFWSELRDCLSLPGSSWRRVPFDKSVLFANFGLIKSSFPKLSWLLKLLRVIFYKTLLLLNNLCTPH